MVYVSMGHLRSTNERKVETFLLCQTYFLNIICNCTHFLAIDIILFIFMMIKNICTLTEFSLPIPLWVDT